MENLFMTVIENLLLILVTLVTGFVVAYIRQRIGTEGMKRIEKQLQVKQDLALLAVQFVEQALQGEAGKIKYAQAATWLQEQAAKVGIGIDEAEIKGLLEATLRAIKDEFGDSWADEKYRR